jgi:hypothetical protein
MAHLDQLGPQRPMAAFFSPQLPMVPRWLLECPRFTKESTDCDCCASW